MTTEPLRPWERLRALWERVGPRTVDVAFIVVALLATLAEAMATRSEGVGRWAPTLAAGLVGVVALWWRRRLPVTVTLIGYVVMFLTWLPIVAPIGLYSVAERRRDRVLVLMTVLTAAVFTLGMGWDRVGPWTDYAALGVIEAGFCAAAGAYVGARRDLVATLRERADRAEAERELKAEQARTGERTRIAREMHDVLAHKVSLIALHAGALEVAGNDDPTRVREAAELIRSTAHEAMEDLRDVLGVLRSGAVADGDDLAPQPGLAEIAQVVEASRAAGVPTDLTVRVVDVPESVARAAYRVVQEALTNAHKHARGAATSVTIDGSEGVGVTIEVANLRPAGGPVLLPGSGAGLLGLRERVDLLGGTFESGPDTAGGWRVVAHLPWPGDAR